MSELEKLLALATVGVCGAAAISFLGWQRQHKPVDALASREFALRLDPLLPMQLWPIQSNN